jgi:CO/xanthine dehydrogenase FAD-binding subunit
VAFRLVAPATVEDAIDVLSGRDGSAGEVAILAGGTDLLLDLDDGHEAPSTLLSLRRLGWNAHRWEEDRLRLGSTTPLAELEDDPELRRRIPGLHIAVRAVGSRALRHRATVGGNLGRAAPTSDLLPVLLALDARVELVGRAGARELPLSEFVRGSRRTERRSDELIRSVVVPARPSTYLWQRVRPANDISQVGLAAARDAAGRWSLAVGGVLPCPRRLVGAEALLHGTIPPAESVAAAALRGTEEAPFATDKRASEEYRRRLIGVLIARAVHELARGPVA